ncbi:Tetratricopeptide repeat-containing protein [Reichenbachiella faecimaris]|uniref:Tetratricopeptide repeat-containing protein n=1 Tax=Reichenbachiella faecimaris TaxID=692418 RepID=A0A1W2GKZ7_REIFA|nr:tetratricopeptide repeat-containing sensor histidine kinase [Reichenbachiella faecimaris]SMD37325.1 Tetratricopeptide repeat-containing protein [Reichenbachiella faecimaris]
MTTKQLHLIIGLLFSLNCSAFCQEFKPLLAQIKDSSISKQIKIVEDSAWAYMYRDYAMAMKFARLASQLALDSKYVKGQGFTYNTIGVIYRKQGKYDSSKWYYSRALNIWRKLSDTSQISTAYLNLANLEKARGNNDSALYFAQTGLLMDIQRKDSLRMSGKYTSLGNIYIAMGQYELAMENFMTVVGIDEVLGDSMNLGIDYANIGDMLFSIDEFEEAKKYYQASITIDSLIDNKQGLAISMGNLAGTLKELGQFEESKTKYLASLQIAQEIGDEIGIAECSINIGALYLNKNQTDSSRQYYNLGLLIAHKLDDDWYKSLAFNGLGKLDLIQEKYKSAIENLQQANRRANKLSYAIVLIDSYKSLAKAYRGIGDNNRAYNYLDKHLTLSDSINDVKTKEKVAELEAKYQNEKYLRQIDVLNHETQLQAAMIERNEFLFLAIGTCSVLLISWIFMTYKRKVYHQRIAMKTQQNQAKSDQIKAVIQSQEAERTRFAMDLHDDFGQLISALRLKVNQNSDKDMETNQMLDKMYLSLKNIAFNLMPQTLVERGLVDAVDELCDQLNQLGSMDVQVRAFEVDELAIAPNKVELYRILQEVLNNIMKYASASKVGISLTGLDNELNIMIEDNGRGFDTKALTLSKGNGWRNIASRLDLMNGTFEVDSVEGQPNSTVSIVIPYLSEAKRVA